MVYNHLNERQALVSTKDPSVGKILVSVEFSPLVSIVNILIQTVKETFLGGTTAQILQRKLTKLSAPHI